jgi:hypothetical protein
MATKTSLELAIAALERLKERATYAMTHNVGLAGAGLWTQIDRDLKEIYAAQKAEACLALQKRKKAGPIRSALLSILPNRKR